MPRKPKPRGPGRPPLGKVARSRYIPIKVTPTEHRTITAAAKAAGLSVSEHCRRRILGESATTAQRSE